MTEASQTGGVKPMAIAGRMVNERERLQGMTNEERLWRKQYLKDQILTNHEPIQVAEYWRERLNPIRRAYKAPLNALQAAIQPALGQRRAFAVRFWTGKFLMSAAAIYATAYYFKYCANDWTRKGGWRVIASRKAVVPGDKEFPKVSERSHPADYAARGFKQSPI